jgi:hypothetical protein
MCRLLAPGFQGFFFMQPLTELMKHTRQVGRVVKQSILLRCLWIKYCLFNYHSFLVDTLLALRESISVLMSIFSTSE